jgi:hypothetical protein
MSASQEFLYKNTTVNPNIAFNSVLIDNTNCVKDIYKSHIGVCEINQIHEFTRIEIDLPKIYMYKNFDNIVNVKPEISNCIAFNRNIHNYIKISSNSDPKNENLNVRDYNFINNIKLSTIFGSGTKNNVIYDGLDKSPSTFSADYGSIDSIPVRITVNSKSINSDEEEIQFRNDICPSCNRFLCYYMLVYKFETNDEDPSKKIKYITTCLDCHQYRQGEPVIYKFPRTIEETIEKINKEQIMYVNERPVEIAFAKWYRPGLEIKPSGDSSNLSLSHKDYTIYKSIQEFAKNIHIVSDKLLYVINLN